MNFIIYMPCFSFSLPPDCNAKYYPLDLYQDHLKEHGTEYFCEVCLKSVPVLDFFPHIATHNQGPFECIYCAYGAKDGPSFKRHLIDQHCNEPPWVCVRFYGHNGSIDPHELASIRLMSLAENAIDDNLVKFVPKEVFGELEQREVGIVISAVQGGFEEPKRQLDPLILDLPENYVFERPIKCQKCNYSTEIRMNLIRHFNLHNEDASFDQENDPVNRISQKVESPKSRKRLLVESHTSPATKPKKKRRMTISELSSSDTAPPEYVPVLQRFRCGVDKCEYMAPEERTLIRHINGIHADDLIFKCPHCDKVLHGWFDVEVIASHYKLHDCQLFQCGVCSAFYGDSRNTVSKHIRKRHKATVDDEDIVSIRCFADEVIKPTAKPAKAILLRRNTMATKRPRLELYKCSYCSFEDGFFEEMLRHAKNVHNHSSQYQCMECKANLNAERGFKRHFTMKHNGRTPEIITHFTSIGDKEPSPSPPPPAAKKQALAPRMVANEVVKPPAAEVFARTCNIVSAKPDLFAEIRLNYRNHPAHRPIVFYCEMCPQKFHDWNRIYDHYKQAHKKSVFNPKLASYLLYSCLFCTFNTPRSATLVDHFQRSHENAMPLYRLEYMVKCMKCDFANTAEKVKEHYGQRHPEERPLMRNMVHQSCGLCAFQYTDEDGLAEHFEKAHKKIANQNLKVNDNSIRQLLNVKVDKVFKCKQCKAVLNNNQSRFHEHASECVPVEVAHRYRCPMCTFLTMDYAEAKLHVSSHKEKSIQCDRCNANFSSYDVLLMHITEHRHVGDYMAALMKQYSVEVIFPNGLVCSESVVAPALDGSHYMHPRMTGSEV